MADVLLTELEALLLGRPPYERQGAPEVSLLVEILPHLPESLLVDALEIAVHQRNPLLRGSLLTVLFARLRGLGNSPAEALAVLVKTRGEAAQATLLGELARLLSDTSWHDLLSSFSRLMISETSTEYRASPLLERLSALLTHAGVSEEKDALLGEALDAMKKRSAEAPGRPEKLILEEIVNDLLAEGRKTRAKPPEAPPSSRPSPSERTVILPEPKPPKRRFFERISPRRVVLPSDDLSGDESDTSRSRSLRKPAPSDRWRVTGTERFLYHRSKPSARRRVVSTGFAASGRPGSPLRRDCPLMRHAAYTFWLEVGAPVRGSIEIHPEVLPVEELPAGAILRVALFSFPGQLEIKPGSDVGELQLQGDGSVVVARQPGPVPEGLSPLAPLLKKRLFFPVQTPPRAGTYCLRCNIYYEKILIQSRLIKARVVAQFRTIKNALRSDLDYTLTSTLEHEHLEPLQTNRLSLMLNQNEDGTDSFHFFGGSEFKNTITFDGQEIQNFINEARGALRMAAWGKEAPWKNEGYRYGGASDIERLRNDLIRFAIRGYRFYDQIIDRLGGGFSGGKALTELMRTPDRLQIAMKRSPRYILPAAMIYDVPFWTNAPLGEITLCKEFLDALGKPDPLEECRCFQGDCPSRGQETRICPSGFWGYRHALGMPLSVGGTDDIAPTIVYQQEPFVDICVSTDPEFTERPEHEKRLQSLHKPMGWRYADTYPKTFEILQGKDQPHLVYFYCHGGMAGTTPYFQVGPTNSTGITREDLRRKGIRWESTRPLIFINGCHTTALEPETAFEFVSAFVEVAAASGVIGTEITVFEPLARTFAEEMLQRFFDGIPVGEAVRRARLALLKKANPLGLVYIPFAVASLKLVQQQLIQL